MKRVTLKDIANRLSLSVSTVSRALSNDVNIRRETRDKILRAAEEMNYKRNTVAAHLRNGYTGAIGVVVDEMFTPYVAQALRGLQEVMQREGISLLIACSYHDPAQEAQNLRAMESAQVDGLIVCPCHDSANRDIMRRLSERGVPIVFFGRNPGGIKASEVVANDYSKAFYLVDHIAKLGKKRIVHVTGDVESLYFNNISKAYTDAVARNGLMPDGRYVIRTKPTFEGGVSAVDEMMRRGLEFDAVFAAADLQAIGVMNRLLEKGFRIPGDVSVAGYAGSYLSKMVFPQLTTVEPPLVEMGEKAGYLLLEKIRDPEAPNRSVTVDARILLRNSTHIP